MLVEGEVRIPEFVENMEIVNITYASLDRPGIYRRENFTLSELKELKKDQEERAASI